MILLHPELPDWQKRAGIEDDLVMVGGVADNYGIVRAIEEHLGHRIIVPKNAQLTGALGAALYAMDIAKKEIRMEGLLWEWPKKVVSEITG